jgi:hypothetical protein
VQLTYLDPSGRSFLVTADTFQVPELNLDPIESNHLVASEAIPMVEEHQHMAMAVPKVVVYRLVMVVKNPFPCYIDCFKLSFEYYKLLKIIIILRSYKKTF